MKKIVCSLLFVFVISASLLLSACNTITYKLTFPSGSSDDYGFVCENDSVNEGGDAYFSLHLNKKYDLTKVKVYANSVQLTPTHSSAEDNSLNFKIEKLSQNQTVTLDNLVLKTFQIQLLPYENNLANLDKVYVSFTGEDDSYQNLMYLVAAEDNTLTADYGDTLKIYVKFFDDERDELIYYPYDLNFYYNSASDTTGLGQFAASNETEVFAARKGVLEFNVNFGNPIKENGIVYLDFDELATMHYDLMLSQAFEADYQIVVHPDYTASYNGMSGNYYKLYDQNVKFKVKNKTTDEFVNARVNGTHSVKDDDGWYIIDAFDAPRDLIEAFDTYNVDRFTIDVLNV